MMRVNSRPLFAGAALPKHLSASSPILTATNLHSSRGRGAFAPRFYRCLITTRLSHSRATGERLLRAAVQPSVTIFELRRKALRCNGLSADTIMRAGSSIFQRLETGCSPLSHRMGILYIAWTRLACD